MTNQQGAPEAPKSTALDGKTELFHVPGHPLLVRAVDFNRLYAENEALQQGYDAARLEIDHLRGATKMMDPAGEYPPLPRPFIFAHESGGVEWPDTFDATQMRTYADATCAMRAQAAPAFIDSTPELHVGGSAFESWYSDYLLNAPVHQPMKQYARDAYAAGMGEPGRKEIMSDKYQPTQDQFDNDVAGGLELSDAGMSLRDYFAAHVIGAAFQDLFAGWRSRGEPVHEDWPMGLAMDAYRVADAMMKVREGGTA